MWELALVVYSTVLLAELLGDKTLYTVGALAANDRLAPVLAGASVAVALKMLAAVLLGHVVAELPAVAISLVSAATFLAMAVAIWLKKPGAQAEQPRPPRRAMRIALAAFASLFFTEWADIGQVTCALLAAKSGAPGLVWLAASLAMLTKIALAATLGVGLRRWVPRDVLRVVTASMCLVMGVLAALRVEV